MANYRLTSYNKPKKKFNFTIKGHFSKAQLGLVQKLNLRKWRKIVSNGLEQIFFHKIWVTAWLKLLASILFEPNSFSWMRKNLTLKIENDGLKQFFQPLKKKFDKSGSKLIWMRKNVKIILFLILTQKLRTIHSVIKSNNFECKNFFSFLKIHNLVPNGIP